MHAVVTALLAVDHEVLTATSVAEALGMLNVHSPDLVILDFSMPTYDGSEIARMAKRICPGCKIVAFSAHTEKHIEAGDWADAYVPKEDVQRLASVVASLAKS